MNKLNADLIGSLCEYLQLYDISIFSRTAKRLHAMRLSMFNCVTVFRFCPYHKIDMIVKHCTRLNDIAVFPDLSVEEWRMIEGLPLRKLIINRHVMTQMPTLNLPFLTHLTVEKISIIEHIQCPMLQELKYLFIDNQSMVTTLHAMKLKSISGILPRDHNQAIGLPYNRTYFSSDDQISTINQLPLTILHIIRRDELSNITILPHLRELNIDICTDRHLENLTEYLNNTKGANLHKLCITGAANQLRLPKLDLPNIKYLKISYMRVVFNYLHMMSKLQNLHLNRCDHSSTLLYGLNKLNLSELYIQVSNARTPPNVGYLSNHDIKSLTLIGYNLNDDIISRLPITLTYLRIERGSITGETMWFPKLQTLYIKSCIITVNGMRKIATMPIRKLKFIHCKLRDEHIEPLSQMSESLEELTIKKSYITIYGLQLLKGCGIRYIYIPMLSLHHFM